MKKSILFLAICTFIGFTASATVHIVTNSGTSFTPDEIHINVGDTVQFNLASVHNAVEVNESTWNTNGTTSNGGFLVPFGGGMVTNLSAGMHYYVCELHASMGMKGKIEVQSSTGILDVKDEPGFSVYPNPFTNKLLINFAVSDIDNDYFEIIDLTGQTVYKPTYDMEIGQNIFSVDLGTLPDGIYFILINQNGGRKTEKIIKQ